MDYLSNRQVYKDILYLSGIFYSDCFFSIERDSSEIMFTAHYNLTTADNEVDTILFYYPMGASTV